MEPLCFVLMPFGRKRDPSGRPDIDFDRVYREAIEPAIRAAGMKPIRADGEETGGIIHKAMFERLLLCEFAVADLTTANANVFYELGVRHTARPRTTVTVFAKHQPLPFDVSFLRALPYELGEDNAFGPVHVEELKSALTKRLASVRALAKDQAPVDSPLFQVLEGFREPDLAHPRTDTFRDRLEYSERIKSELAAARAAAKDVRRAAVDRVRAEIGDLDGAEAGVLVDLFLSYRAIEAWDAMTDLYPQLPEVIRRSVTVREQYAFALNRRAGKEKRPEDRAAALRILEEVESERGANPETCGLIGRIFKDRWQEAKRAGDPVLARGELKKAIAAYVRGFEADWRDVYPGINALTLLDIEGSQESEVELTRLLGVVRFSLERKMRSKEPDYWDHATSLELAVLSRDHAGAEVSLADARAAVRETWEPSSTANNLRMIEEARRDRGEDVTWLKGLIAALEKGA